MFGKEEKSVCRLYGSGEGIWKVLRIYGVEGKLLRAVKSMYEYERAKAAVRVEDELREFFEPTVGLKQGCVMSPWLFNVFMDGVGITMMKEGEAWKIPVILFAGDAVLLSED